MLTNFGVMPDEFFAQSLRKYILVISAKKDKKENFHYIDEI